MDSPTSPSPRPRVGRVVLNVGRYCAELIAALVLLAFASEEWSHRDFSSEPIYGFTISGVTIIVLWLGILPLVHHVYPRLARFLFGGWLLLIAAFVVLGNYISWLSPPRRAPGQSQSSRLTTKVTSGSAKIR